MARQKASKKPVAPKQAKVAKPAKAAKVGGSAKKVAADEYTAFLAVACTALIVSLVLLILEYNRI